MKRRQFFKNAALLGVAAPMVTLRNFQDKTDCYESIFYYTAKHPVNNKSLFWQVNACKAALMNPGDAAENDRFFALQVYQFVGDSKAVWQGKFQIIESKLVSNSSKSYEVKSKLISIIQENLEIPYNIQFKKFNFIFDKNQEPCFISISDKKGNNVVKIHEDIDDYEDCYLTTACVNHMGKSDDCAELTILRNFRDNVLLSSIPGRELVRQYYAFAPQLLQCINQDSEKNRIYDSIYSEMIMPVIECIDQRKNEEAIALYRNFTLQLKEKYMS